MPYKDLDKAREANRKSYHKYNEARKLYGREYYALEDKEHKARINRKSYFKRFYNITLEEYEILYQKQKGLCAICYEELQGGIKTHVDHDHNTGKVRGILCKACNNGIGLLKDSIPLLLSAVEYLKG